MPGQIGLIQATEVIKLILKKGKPLIGRFLIYNALEMDFKTFSVGRNPSCHLCGEKAVIEGLVDYHDVCSRSSAGMPSAA